MSRITEGHLVHLYQNAKGGRDAALLDLAQDHALWHLHRIGLFERRLTFKGGTALRKFRAEDIGYFTKPVRLDDWLSIVHARCAFLADLTTDERRWATANARYLNEVTAKLAPDEPRP